MTEKQLRAHLQAYLASADLPDSRKQALLQQISAATAKEKGEPNMFRPNKLHTVLVIAAIVTLLSLTVALAAGLSGYVDYKGKPVEGYPLATTTPLPTQEPAPTQEVTQEAFDAFVTELFNVPPTEQLIEVSFTQENGGSSSSMPARAVADSLSELEELVGTTMVLPTIPEGFVFEYAWVYLACDGDSAYELVSEETTPEGFCIRRYAIPEGKTVATSFSFVLRNAAGETILCDVGLGFESDRHFRVTEADEVQTPAVPGMEEALLIAGDDGNHLYLRHTLEAPIKLWTDFPDCWDWFPHDAYTTVEYSVASTTVPADVLLSIFAK
ncbi:MAG: hypothetical protein PUC00_07610 [Clostridiales bacterium]|nr:hypothetical protein [Clostridiales bacterium]